MKIDKYDRQVRIWGPEGQRKLTQSKIAIIGCSGASVEAAKNLILPGIGRIDILDNKKISVEDLSSSFFYTHESVNNLKGEEASKNLLEMNPDVEGEFKNVSVEEIVGFPEKYLNEYNLVVCTNLLQEESLKVSEICWKLGIPVIFATSVGFFFHVRSQKELHIVESENIAGKKYYLRLHDPFDGLKEYVEKKELKNLLRQLSENQENHETKKGLEKDFSKITYPVFLIEAYTHLKQEFDRSATSQEVKQLLQEWRSLVTEDHDIRNGINEALTRTFDLFQPYDNFLPNVTIFEDPNVINATNDSHFIYIFLKAVKEFISRYNNLPQIVRLPDISTTTKDFLELKNIYKQEHEKHKILLKEIIKELFVGYEVDDKLLGEYVNNIDALQIVKMRAYFDELREPDVLGACMEYLGDVKSLFVALRAYKAFEQHHNRSPTPADFPSLLETSQHLSSQWHLTGIDSRFIQEICRYEGKSLISYESMAGAIIGQESIKLLTNCFTPMNNGYFFDGLQCKGYTVAL